MFWSVFTAIKHRYKMAELNRIMSHLYHDTQHNIILNHMEVGNCRMKRIFLRKLSDLLNLEKFLS